MRPFCLLSVIYIAVVSALLTTAHPDIFKENLNLEARKSVSLLEDSPCDDDRGTCKIFDDCPLAVQQFLQSRRNHLLDRCGFIGNDEIVCCPNKEETTTTTTTSTTQPTIVDKFPEIVKSKSLTECDKLIVEIGSQVTPQILDGEDALIGQFPHMAGLGFLDLNGGMKWQCGAALISDKFVITAAHCIINVNGLTPSKVRIGRVDINSPNGGDAQEFNIINTTVHPKFNRKQSINDIALLELDQKIKRSPNVHPACLYYRNDEPMGLVATGWGATKLGDQEGSPILQKASLEPVSLKECNVTYAARGLLRLTDNHICAKSPTGRNSDTCQGDSGGPLQVQPMQQGIYSIVGVTSTGSGCGGNIAGVYTRVSSYLEWIEMIVWP